MGEYINPNEARSGEGNNPPPKGGGWVGEYINSEENTTASAISGENRGYKEELYADQQIRAYARELRRNQTPAEAKLWERLRNQQLGAIFRRQQAIGNFVVDFCCLPAKLIIEVDGDSHTERPNYDATRTRWLERNGWRVMRFTNAQVHEQLDEVMKAIAAECQRPPG